MLETTGVRAGDSVVPLDWMLWAPRPLRLYRYIHSRLRQLDIGPEAVADVMREYGLEPTGEPRNLPMGWRNRSVVVHTPVGKKLLKLYRPKWPLGSVLCEHSVLTRLAQLNIPVPTLVPTCEGRTYIVRPCGIYALFDYVKGESLSLTYMPRSLRLKLGALSGQALARIHRELEGFVPQGKHHLGFSSYTGDRRPHISWYVERAGELEEESRHLRPGPARDYTDQLARAGTFALDELCRLDETLCGARMPLAIIHGDYGFHNLLFHDSYKLTVLDFELARLEWRLSEIVSTLPRYWRPGAPRDFEGMKAFLFGYEMEYPLTQEEWRLFPQVWAYQHLRAAVKYWNSYFEVSQELRRLARARNALSHAKEGQYVADRLRSSCPRKGD